MQANETNWVIKSRAIGMRVELAPHLDRWMMGDCYGEVVKVTRQRIHVKLDKSGSTIRLLPDQFRFI